MLREILDKVWSKGWAHSYSPAMPKALLLQGTQYVLKVWPIKMRLEDIRVRSRMAMAPDFESFLRTANALADDLVDLKAEEAGEKGCPQ